jgi:predicted phage terminase large subunit-like protein
VRCTDQLLLTAHAHHKRVAAEREARISAEIPRYVWALEASVRAEQEAREKARREAREEALTDEERKLQELASRALARRSLLHFVERKIPSYVSGWVHEDIARRIERFVEQVERGESPRLMLFVPPRHGKSELASESGPEWILGHHPEWTVMLTSYSEELPKRFSRAIREYVQSQEYREVFPRGPRVSEIDASVTAWATEQGGMVRAAGVGGGILGMGAHVLIVDDPVKDQEAADSPAVLDGIYDWLTSTAYSRLAPGGGIILIQQRWSDSDPAGRLEERMLTEEREIFELREEAAELATYGDPESTAESANLQAQADELDASIDRWDIVRYPALATGDEYLTASGDITPISDGAPIPEGCRLLRRKGEALHPQRYSRLYLLKLKRANPRRFSAMYQQRPVDDEGIYFQRSNFIRVRPEQIPPLKNLQVVCAWDLAIGIKQQNDYTVGVAGGQDAAGNIWFLQRIRGRWNDLEVVAGMVIDMHVRNQAVLTGVERTQLEMALSPILHRKMRERAQYIPMAEGKEALKPITDKAVRARPFQALAKAGKVRVPMGEDWDDFIGWLVKFGSTKVDDDVDAAAWLGQMVERMEPPPSPNAEIEQREREAAGAFVSWWDEVLEEQMGSTEGGFMGA